MIGVSYLIDFKNISFAYENNEILKDLSLNIDSEKFYILMGENGSGKSTLIKLLLGIEKPICGNIYFENKDISENIYEARKNIGIVFQNPDEQIVSEIVEEEIAFSMENYGYSSKIMNEKIDRLLGLVNLQGKRKMQISKMSGGEKQRLCIASALALDPKILLIDEGTSMLDIKNRNNILSLIKNIKEEMGVTIILITHHLNELEFCDEVIFLNKGKIEFKGDKFIYISSLIKNEFGKNINLNSTFKIAKNIYKYKKIDISKDIFNIKKVGEYLWNSL